MENALLTATNEAHLVEAYQAGDPKALDILAHAYDAWLRKLARQQARRSSVPFDDLLQEARLAFMESTLRADPRRRLSTIARPWVEEALRDACHPAAFAIPPRTFRRYWAVMREAGTPEEGARIAPTHGLAVDTFWAVHRAATGASSLDASPVETPAAVETAVEAAQARHEAAERLARLNDRERLVVEHAFGFATGSPMSDDEVAKAVGLSRPTVQRVRVSALEKMAG